MLSIAITGDTCGGQPVSPGDVVVKFTYYGDANLDGNVDAGSILSGSIAADNANYNSVNGWSNGDFNYDGNVDKRRRRLMLHGHSGQQERVRHKPLALQ